MTNLASLGMCKCFLEDSAQGFMGTVLKLGCRA